MSISTKIQTLRKQHNLTQEQLADQLNVSRQALSKWELGVSTPEADKIVQLSDYFKVSTDYLLKDSIETNEPIKKGHSSPRLTIIRSTAIVFVGLIAAFARGLDGSGILYLSFNLVAPGLIIQVIGLLLFEILLSDQQKSEQTSTRLLFYAINIWFILLIPVILFFGAFDKFIFYFIRINDEVLRLLVVFGFYGTICLIGSMLFIRKTN